MMDSNRVGMIDCFTRSTLKNHIPANHFLRSAITSSISTVKSDARRLTLRTASVRRSPFEPDVSLILPVEL